jgi:hypothetical protein
LTAVGSECARRRDRTGLAQRCMEEHPLQLGSFLVLALFMVSVASAVVWGQFSLTTILLIAARTSRKASVKQGVSPYAACCCGVSAPWPSLARPVCD